MNSLLLRHCVAYLLLALLPLQALAASRLALCAEITNSSHTAAESMKDCAQMAQSSGPKADDSAPPSHGDKSCWLGSICLASVIAFAMPISHHVIPVERAAPVYFSATTNYRSVILDNLQRPPATL